MIRKLVTTSLVLALVGCSSESTEEQSAAALDRWLGDAPHFVLQGRFDGRDWDIDLRGDAAIAANVRCLRVYAPRPEAKPDASGFYDPNQYYLVFKEMEADVEVDGALTKVSMGSWRYDPAPGTELSVVPRIRGGSIAEGTTWADMELSSTSATLPDGIEKYAESGKVKFELSTGEKVGEFVASGGRAGVYMDVTWGPDESVRFSGAADCIDSQIGTFGRTLVTP